MSVPAVRVAGADDAPALAALRRAWTTEQNGPVDDPGFEARFRDWYDRESARRVSWLAEVRGQPAGMMNMAVFDRMPQPGRAPVSWGYLGNAYVLPAFRNQGIPVPGSGRRAEEATVRPNAGNLRDSRCQREPCTSSRCP